MDVEKANTLTLLMLEKATAYHGWIFEEIKPFLRGTLLEVGCGTGNLTGWLLQQGRVVVADINEDYLQVVREKYGKHSNLIGTLVWDIVDDHPKKLHQSVDTIVCSNVLEHVEDDEIVLSHFYKLLPDGGRLILLVPAMKVLYNHLDLRLGHFRRYGREELIQKLKRNGFRVDHWAYFNFFGILGWFFNGTLMKKQMLPEGQMQIFNQLVPFFKRAEKMIPNRVGQSLIAVGEKG